MLEHGFEKIQLAPPPEVFDINQLVQRVCTGGWPDYSLAEKEDQVKLASWYADNKGKLSETMRVAHFEQILFFGLVSEKESLIEVMKASKQFRAEIGRYIHDVLAPTRFLSTFYACWDDLPSLERESIRKSALENGGYDLAMIAPFVDLASIDILKPQTGKLDKDRFEKARVLHDMDLADKILSSCTDFLEEGGKLWGDRSALASFYLKRASILTVPHYQALVDKSGFNLSKGEVDAAINQGCSGSQLVATDWILEQKENCVRQYAEIRDELFDEKKLKKRSGKEKQLADEYSAFENERVIRLARIVYRNVAKTGILSKRSFGELLRVTADNPGYPVPVFAAADVMGADKKRIARLVQESWPSKFLFAGMFMDDIEELLRINKESDEGPDLERLIVDTIRGTLAPLSADLDDVLTVEAERLLERFSEILNALPRKSREEIVGYVDTKCKGAWLLAPRAFNRWSALSWNDLIEEARHHKRTFVKWLNTFFVALGDELTQWEDQGEIRQKLKSLTQELVSEDPSLLVLLEKTTARSACFSGEDVDGLIRQYLGGKTTYGRYDPVVSHLFISGEYGKYVKEIKQFILENPETLSNLEALDPKAAFEVMGREGFLFAMKGQAERLVGRKNDHLAHRLLATDPSAAKAVIDELSQKMEIEKLASFTVYLEDNKYLMFIDVAERKWALERIKTLEKAMSDNEYLRPDNLPADDRFLWAHRDEVGDSLPFVVPEGQTLCGQVAAMAKEATIECLRANPEAVMKEEVIKAVGVDVARPLLQEVLPAHAEKNPAILLGEHFASMQIADPTIYRETLGVDLYRELCRKYARFLALDLSVNENLVFNAYTSYFRENLMEFDSVWREVGLLNPLHYGRLGSRDYYDIALEAAFKTTYGKLVAKRMVAIAEREHEMHGMVRANINLKANVAFLKELQRCFLFERSPHIQKWLGTIGDMEKRRREGVLEQCTIAALYNLDADPDLQSDTFEGFLQGLSRSLHRYASLTLGRGVEEWDESKVPIDTVVDLTRYVQSLEGKKETDTLNALRPMVGNILSGDFENWRAWDGKEPVDSEERSYRIDHLRKKEYIPVETTDDQYVAWVKSSTVPLEAQLVSREQDLAHGIKSILDFAVVDGHVNKEELAPASLGDDTSESVSRLADEAQDNYADNKLDSGGLLLIKNSRAKKLLTAIRNIKISSLEKMQIELEDGRVVPIKTACREIVAGFPDHPAFANDVQRIAQFLQEKNREIFGGQVASRQRLYVTDRVDLGRHLRIGQVPVPSCQNFVNGELNEGLAYTILDPACKIVQVETEDGRLIARSVLRLVNKGDGGVALFMERTYENNPNLAVTMAMVEFAKAKAASMGCKLYATEVDAPAVPCHVKLSIRGGRMPLVYSDANGIGESDYYQIEATKEILFH